MVAVVSQKSPDCCDPDQDQPQEWVVPNGVGSKNEQLLRALQFQYLEGNVLEEEGTDETASATVRVRLFVVTGEVRQAERYSLKKVGKHWLIDTQEIRHERLIAQTV